VANVWARSVIKRDPVARRQSVPHLYPRLVLARAA